MCGIAGILQVNGKAADASLVRGMTETMAHRGPDADGFFTEGEMALGHRRLAIIDLSAAANQPFSSNDDRYKLIFNGEIYNYAEVKPLLQGYHFRTNSDTEVLLAAYITWGAACLSRFRGMFTAAIWDRQEKELFIARDPMGVKPLYYYADDEQLIFASEIRAILSTGLVKKKVSRQALLDYFSYQSVTHPYSIIDGILQLEAGSWMKIRNGKMQQEQYWDVTLARNDAAVNDKTEVQRRIRDLMLQSVKRRLVSDVPVGAFLSGGIDSSVVVGLMAEADSGRPNTFHVCFDEKEYDESSYADIIAKKFNTHHTRILLKPSVFLDELQQALNAMDMPSGDGINTFVVSKAIHEQGMTVALSGIGGDELFAGYPYFNQYVRLQHKKWLWKLPLAIRELSTVGAGSRKERLQQLLKADAPSIDHAYPVFRQILSPKLLHAFTSLNGKGHFMTSLQQELSGKKENLQRLPALSQFSAAEYLGYTQHTLLRDTDQMSMAVSLEVREPFFDQDLVEFVLAVPDHLKNTGSPKGLLVESVHPLLPDEVVFRKKQGFLFPWNLWLRNELCSFCEQHIRSMCARPFIHGKKLAGFWESFLKGDKHIRWTEIWLFVVLDYWMDRNGVEY